MMQKTGWQKRVIIGLVVAVLVISAGLARAKEPLVLTQKDNGRTVTVAVGQGLKVELDLDAGQYVVVPEFDASILALVGQSLQSTTGPKGASSRVVYDFLVRQSGQTQLVIATKGKKSAPLLKVKIVATGGGQTI
jgi:hypothetical protein